MIKLLALDMDGTLLNEPGNPTSPHHCHSSEPLKRCQTGSLYRSPAFRCPPYYKKLGLDLQNRVRHCQ